MASTYTGNLRFVIPTTGELAGTWGDVLSAGVTQLADTAISGTVTITMTAANYTLSTASGAADEARAMFLSLAGTPGAPFNVICPAVSKLYFVKNGTGFAQTVKTSAGTGISVPNGKISALYCDGTNVVEAITAFIAPALGTPASGVATNLTGTAAGLTAGSVTTNANLTGDVTSVGNATTLTNAPVIAKVLTGYVSGAGTVAATDSILQAVQKLNGNDALRETLTNKDATGGYAGLTLFKINFKNAANTFTSFFTNAATAARTYTFPDKDITVAGLVDITGTNSGTNTGDQTTVTGNAGTATSLTGGSGGTIPYQSAAGVTSMLANGTAGQVLQSNGTTLAPSYVTPSAGVSPATSTPLVESGAGAVGTGTTYARNDHVHPAASGSLLAYTQFNSSATWTRASGTTKVFVEVLGGGGNGGAGDPPACTIIGGGGGGSAQIRTFMDSAPPASCSITVGASSGSSTYAGGTTVTAAGGGSGAGGGAAPIGGAGGSAGTGGSAVNGLAGTFNGPGGGGVTSPSNSRGTSAPANSGLGGEGGAPGGGAGGTGGTGRVRIWEYA